MTFSRLHLFAFTLCASIMTSAETVEAQQPGRTRQQILTAATPDAAGDEAKAADQVIPVWPGTPPNDERELGAEQDFTKPTDKLIAGRRIIKLGNVATPEAHVYFPSEEKRNGSAIVICPGGGFHILAWDLEGTEVAEWLTPLGVTAIVLKYRVPTNSIDPAWLPPVQDAQRTMSLVRSRADEWGLDADRIGILGFSAGGVTAARTALASERLYEAIDDIDTQPCGANAAVILYPGGMVNKDGTALLDDVLVTKDAPPMFFAHAFDDPVRVESSLQLFLALKRANVPSELHVYDAGGHGYGLRHVADHPVTTWPDRCTDWLRRNGWVK